MYGVLSIIKLFNKFTDERNVWQKMQFIVSIKHSEEVNMYSWSPSAINLNLVNPGNSMLSSARKMFFVVAILFVVVVVLGDNSRFWLSYLGTLVLLLQRLYLAWQSFDFERTWRRLFHNRVVCSKLFVFVRCFACPNLKVALDCLFWQDYPFLFSLSFIFFAISAPLFYSNLMFDRPCS